MKNIIYSIVITTNYNNLKPQTDLKSHTACSTTFTSEIATYNMCPGYFFMSWISVSSKAWTP